VFSPIEAPKSGVDLNCRSRRKHVAGSRNPETEHFRGIEVNLGVGQELPKVGVSLGR
jgi:hypothetical protein